MVEPNCAGPEAASNLPLIGSKRKSVPRTRTEGISGCLGEVMRPFEPLLEQIIQLSTPSLGLVMRDSWLLLAKPVYRTSLTSALPSPSVSFMNRISGAQVTIRPPFHGMIPLTARTLSAKIVVVSYFP